MISLRTHHTRYTSHCNSFAASLFLLLLSFDFSRFFYSRQIVCLFIMLSSHQVYCSSVCACVWQTYVCVCATVSIFDLFCWVECIPSSILYTCMCIAEQSRERETCVFDDVNNGRTTVKNLSLLTIRTNLRENNKINANEIIAFYTIA